MSFFLQTPPDITAHNAEVAAVWQAYRAGRPYRVQLRVHSFDTGFPLDPGAARQALGADVQLQGAPRVTLLKDGPVALQERGEVTRKARQTATPTTPTGQNGPPTPWYCTQSTAKPSAGASTSVAARRDWLSMDSSVAP